MFLAKRSEIQHNSISFPKTIFMNINKEWTFTQTEKVGHQISYFMQMIHSQKRAIHMPKSQALHVSNQIIVGILTHV